MIDKLFWGSFVTTLIAGLLFALFATTKTAADVSFSRETSILSERQQIWLDALIWCESRDISAAINPKDRDGTPSYGLLQFKPSTLKYFEKAYGITGELMSSSTQKAIVSQMIVRGGIDWHQQFPDCVKHIGEPPR